MSELFSNNFYSWLHKLLIEARLGRVSLKRRIVIEGLEKYTKISRIIYWGPIY